LIRCRSGQKSPIALDRDFLLIDPTAIEGGFVDADEQTEPGLVLFARWQRSAGVNRRSCARKIVEAAHVCTLTECQTNCDEWSD
jgi:hypothetical protein